MVSTISLVSLVSISLHTILYLHVSPVVSIVSTVSSVSICLCLSIQSVCVCRYLCWSPQPLKMSLHTILYLHVHIFTVYSLFSLLWSLSLHTIFYLHVSPVISTVYSLFSLLVSVPMQFYICMYVSPVVAIVSLVSSSPILSLHALCIKFACISVSSLPSLCVFTCACFKCAQMVLTVSFSLSVSPYILLYLLLVSTV